MFGWEVEKPGAYWRARAWVLRVGLQKTSDVLEREGISFLLNADQRALADDALALLSRFPDEARRVRRHFSFVCIAPGGSEFSASERLAFIARKKATSAPELVIALNEVALLAWHLRVGGGLSSRVWKPIIDWSIHRCAHAFAMRVLENEPDPSVRARVSSWFPDLASP